MKRTPLRRYTLLKARKRINPMSAKRRSGSRVRAEVREAVFDRDHWRCRLADVPDVAGRCMGDLTYHHLHKASAGGAYTVENGVCLCAFHNEWVEMYPIEATALGLVRRERHA